MKQPHSIFRPLEIYNRYLGHQLSELEICELQAKYEECIKHKYGAAGCCCFAASGVYGREAAYIKDILEGNDLTKYDKYMKDPNYFLIEAQKIEDLQEQLHLEARQALKDIFHAVGASSYLMPEDKEDEEFRFLVDDWDGEVAWIYAFCYKDDSLFFKADDEWGDDYQGGDWVDIKEYHMEYIYATMYKIVAEHADMIKKGRI